MSAEVQTPPKVDTLDASSKRKTRDPVHRRTINLSGSVPNKKHKTEDGRHNFKFAKKRSQNPSGGKLFPPYKKRKKEKLIPPTKFLLGGNIRDPLNLNSLQDEEVNRAMNAVTPESSPVPTPQHRKGPIEVIIPADIHDPLGLGRIGSEDDEEYAASFTHPTSGTGGRPGLKKKNKKRRSRGSSGPKDEPSGELKAEEATKPEVKAGEVERPKELHLEKQEEVKESKRKEEETTTTPTKEKEFKRPKAGGGATGGGDKKEKRTTCVDPKDRIVSPVIPQPGAWPGTGRFRKQPGGRRPPHQPTPSFKESRRKFQYGNYNRYYGYRNLGQDSDPRLKVLARLSHLFLNKEVLDVGCNTGLISVGVARELGARSVVGIDIDRGLIEAARLRARRSSPQFPASMPLLYGPLDVPGVQASKTFPHNLTFVQGNYVLENDVLLELEQAQFDVILCLSVTKWLHLNWGDEGLKRAFRRMFLQLRPGGVLILEPQNWSSYKKKKNLTETTWRNYQNIKFFPVRFTEYLLSEVGFSKCEVVGSPLHPHKGFQRPIKVFTKGGGETPVANRTPVEMSEAGGSDEVVDEVPLKRRDVEVSEPEMLASLDSADARNPDISVVDASRNVTGAGSDMETDKSVS